MAGYGTKNAPRIRFSILKAKTLASAWHQRGVSPQLLRPNRKPMQPHATSSDQRIENLLRGVALEILQHT